MKIELDRETVKTISRLSKELNALTAAIIEVKTALVAEIKRQFRNGESYVPTE